MNRQEENDDRIIKYIDGEMTASEQSNFERDLQSDELLQQEFDRLQTAAITLRHYGLKADVAAVHQDMMKVLQKSPLSVRQGLFSNLGFKIAAAIVLILFLGLLYQFITLNPDKIHNEQYIAYTTTADRGIGRLSAIANAYQKLDYKSAVRYYEEGKSTSAKDDFLSALAYYNLRDFKNAENLLSQILKKDGTEGNYHDDAEYYLALIYLSKHAYQEAILIFEKIHQDKTHIYHEKVSSTTLLKLRLLKLKG
ncbi:tol-pal system YbgF family protein [Pedobacter sandarakinus]|uniref:hypothetical protein n=1 Tax=Pedobacter sandarakinus TaxID=353156 RepID=UPI0022463033|nr:hypothetical protein [Pedobacter sandarakinus]MCX2575291.1 hypothetical protein [Pedobacter sandarakinus]